MSIKDKLNKVSDKVDLFPELSLRDKLQNRLILFGVNIFAEYPVSILVEILAHELAHVAVGPGHDHDGLWEEAFENIYQEYNNIGINRYCKEE